MTVEPTDTVAVDSGQENTNPTQQVAPGEQSKPDAGDAATQVATPQELQKPPHDAGNDLPFDQVADNATADEQTALDGAPEQYEQFQVRDGFKVSEEVMNTVIPKFKELGLSQEKAQTMFDLYTDLQVMQNDAITKQTDAILNDWREEIIRDPELGGDNDAIERKYTEIQKVAAALDPNLWNELGELGLHTNPTIMKALYRASKSISEDTLVRDGTTTPAADKPPWDRVYSNTNDDGSSKIVNQK